jgi:hypothetical protein
MDGIANSETSITDQYPNSIKVFYWILLVKFCFTYNVTF